MTKLIPEDVTNYFNTFYKDENPIIGEIERYENIYMVEFVTGGIRKTAYIRVTKNRMSDSVIE